MATGESMKKTQTYLQYKKNLRHFTIHRLKMLQQQFLVEKNPIPHWTAFGAGGCDPSSGVFLDWITEKLNKGTPFLTNKQIQLRVDEYNFKLNKAK
jgi:hypothetical protein